LQRRRCRGHIVFADPGSFTRASSRGVVSNAFLSLSRGYLDLFLERFLLVVKHLEFVDGVVVLRSLWGFFGYIGVRKHERRMMLKLTFWSSSPGAIQPGFQAFARCNLGFDLGKCLVNVAAFSKKSGEGMTGESGALTDGNWLIVLRYRHVELHKN
jgi:hypothetical protein